VVFDRVDASADTTRVWQLNSAYEPALADDVARLGGASADLDVWLLGPEGATPQVVDWTTDDDMSGGWRLDVAHSSGDGRSRFLHVLSVEGAVTDAVAVSEGSLEGADLLLVDGGSAEFRFAADSWGGTLRVLDAAGAETLTAALEPGVAELPVMDDR
jgi:hypothetical protein